MKAYALLFDTKRMCKLIKTNVEDGHIFIEDKAFYVDTNEPLYLRKWHSTVPLYILKWNDIKPSKNINPEKPNSKVIERVQPEFESDEKTPEIIPELYRKLIGLKILGNMIKVRKKPEFLEFLYIGIGLVVGVLLMYALLYFKILHF